LQDDVFSKVIGKLASQGQQIAMDPTYDVTDSASQTPDKAK